MYLSVFLDHYELESVDELRLHLGFRHQREFGAFWLTPAKDTFPAIALFINGVQSCMFYIREDGDPGFHSLGTDLHNFKDEVDFVIDNFQLDAYPLAMVIPTSQGISALEEFFRTSAQPRAVRWFEV